MENEMATRDSIKDKVHHGENIRMLRTLLDMKQEVLAIKLGPTWSQKRVSLVESKPEIDMRTIWLIAETLGVNHTMITSFTPNSFIETVKRCGSEIVHKRSAPKPLNEDILLESFTKALSTQNRFLRDVLNIHRQHCWRVEQLLSKDQSCVEANSNDSKGISGHG